MDITNILIKEFSLKPSQVENTVKLIDEGNTIPFIARYRKELTDSLDDQILRELNDRLTYLRSLKKRKEEVLASIEEQGKLTDEISASLDVALTLSEVEDIYRPFKQKRKTRASVAKERGLQPLADIIYAQDKAENPLELARDYIDEEKGVNSAEDALNGALDIIAEIVSDDAATRKIVREYTYKNAQVTAKGNKEKKSVYEMYYEYSEAVATIAPHRILAIDRGEREEFLKVSIVVDKIAVTNMVSYRFVKGTNACADAVKNACADAVKNACADAYDRLISPSIEREIRNILTKRASIQAIKVFSVNLKNLLMQPPVKGSVTLGLDPAFRTGCKIAVVDDTGKVLDSTVIYPTPPQSKIEEAKVKLKALIEKHNVTVIAIGNGTASRESEQFVAELIKELDCKLSYIIVSEAGASVYSASKLASEEFPQFDVSIRSAISIARRLQDPLAELVKIDPMAVGVGQYQHDMQKNMLNDALTGVVEDCVNSVGINLNTASAPLLSKVSGINMTVAKNIVAFREENGAFKSRAQLKKVPKLGTKAYVQAAGFLRVSESKNVLDKTAVHPESYKAAESLLSLCDISVNDINTPKIENLPIKAKEIGLSIIAEKIGTGIPTLEDIIKELQKPGRDPREELPKPLLRTDVLSLNDLNIGMELIGTVRNVIDFGAFVDIGVHEDGLVHISQIADKYISHPSQVLSVGDIVKVRVLTIDKEKKRIGLTMRLNSPQ